MKLKISKTEYDVEEKIIDLNDLEFYKENPRIYSFISSLGGEPSQDEIQSKMVTMDHVKELRISIKANGGVIDPLIVLKREDIYVVLEGNSRLAAYRLLFQEDPIAWREVKCWILPSDFSEDAIFTLLGQYHLISRKDWSLFEQAGYLYRKRKSSGLDIEVIARQMGLNEATAKKYVDIYSFMKDNNDLVSEHWSYYEEYLKNRGIKQYRKTLPTIDTTFVKQVKDGSIKQALDVRVVLGKVATTEGRQASRIMNEFISGKTSIYDGLDRLEDSGKTNDAYKTICKFREKIDDSDFQKKIKQAQDLSSMRYELKKLQKTVSKLLNEFSN